MGTVMNKPSHIHSLIGDTGLEWMESEAVKMQTIVEVGCWLGGGTWVLCTACSGTVYAVDHWKGSPDPSDATYHPAKERDIYEEFWNNVGHFPHLKIVKMPSVEAAKLFPWKSIDMVVIDAGHDDKSAEEDMHAWFPITKKLFCGHDWGHLGVRNAIQRLNKDVTHHPNDMWSIQCDG
jgi:hypothetical protein